MRCSWGHEPARRGRRRPRRRGRVAFGHRHHRARQVRRPAERALPRQPHGRADRAGAAGGAARRRVRLPARGPARGLRSRRRADRDRRRRAGQCPAKGARRLRWAPSHLPLGRAGRRVLRRIRVLELPDDAAAPDARRGHRRRGCRRCAVATSRSSASRRTSTRTRRARRSTSTRPASSAGTTTWPSRSAGGRAPPSSATSIGGSPGSRSRPVAGCARAPAAERYPVRSSSRSTSITSTSNGRRSGGGRGAQEAGDLAGGGLPGAVGADRGCAGPVADEVDARVGDHAGAVHDDAST